MTLGDSVGPPDAHGSSSQAGPSVPLLKPDVDPPDPPGRPSTIPRDLPQVDTAKAMGHRRTSSLTSPPPPPLHFNPPPNFPTEPPLLTIQTPSTSSIPSLDDVRGGDDSPGSPHGLDVQVQAHRPQIIALQRFSNDSHNSHNSSGSVSSITGSSSEGGDVLAAKRDQLVSHLLTSEGSSESTTTIRGATSASPGEEGDFEWNVEGQTPSASATQLTSEALSQVEAETARSSSSFDRPRTLSNRSSEEMVHAWDSVWPSANAMHRASLGSQNSSVRFPLAPMSPYSTPSFSPAVVQTTRRLSGSPPRATSPRIAGGTDSTASTPGSDRGSNRIHLQARASPSHGLASPDPDLSSHSPPYSPRLVSSYPSTDVHLPGSPSGVARTSRRLVASGSPGPSRDAGGGGAFGTSPPSTLSFNPTTGRSRAERASFVTQFSELAPPFISLKELLVPPPTNRLTRRLSETAIIRRPDATLRLDAQGQPALHSQTDLPASQPVDLSSTSPMDSGATVSTLPVRPGGPRRARSAQEALGTPYRQMFSMSAAQDSLLSSPSERSPPVVSGPTSPRAAELARLHRSPPRREFNELASTIEVPEGTEHLPVFDEDDDDDEYDPQTFTLREDVCALLSSGSEDESASLPDTLHDANEPSPPSLPSGLVDEGDLLPTGGMIEMDVTFDDEGLNTLERIFLLSQSEYAFHRAYVARVLGDLLGDVDPCESVEYVLPLVSGFSLDEDDTVKEAFAADLHRILWYFFSTCELVVDEEQTHEPFETRPEMQTAEASYDSTHMEYVEPPIPPSIKASPDRDPDPVHSFVVEATTPPEELPIVDTLIADAPIVETPAAYDRASPILLNEESSAASTASTFSPRQSVETDTPITSVANSVGSGSLPDPSMLDHPLGKGMDPESYDDVENVASPVLAVGFFRPLLGTLLLSQNPSIADSVRAGIVALIARLRKEGEVTPETWGAHCDEVEVIEEQTFISQTGPHSHTIQPFEKAARELVEQELLHGIVLGMGTLSTDVPESLFDNSVEIVGECEEDAADRKRDEELFAQQMIHEATLGRALSLSFIGSISELYTPDEVIEYGFVDEVIRGLDGDATTRAEAALAMSFVAKAAPVESIDRLLPVFEAFANDESQQVRQSACVCLPSLCKRIQDEDQRREFAVKALETFMASSEDVRAAALEALGEVIYTFASDPLGPPPQLLEVYVDDLESTGEDCDWDILATFNFPGVCLTLGPSRWDELRGLFMRLVERSGEKVFRTIATFLHELAQILDADQVAHDILPVYRRCLGCPDEIRERVFEHVDVIISRLPLALGWECFKELADAWNNDTLGGWRAREQLALQIPSFLETFRQHDEVAAVLRMMRSALLDPFAAVRDAATYAVAKSYEILGRSHCSSTTFHEMLLEFANSPRYRQRLTFVRCLREFIRPPPNKKAFEDIFIPALPRLSKDIVDVRLALARAVTDLFIVGAFYGDKSLPVPGIVRRITQMLSRDESVDVREVIAQVGGDRWASGDQSAEEALEDGRGANPIGAEATIAGALTSGGAEDNAADLHSHAGLPSPDTAAGGRGASIDLNAELDDMVRGDHDADDLRSLRSLDSLSSSARDDPFDASFARATSLPPGGFGGVLGSPSDSRSASLNSTSPRNSLERIASR